MSEPSSLERALAEIERLTRTIAEQDVKRAQLQREVERMRPVFDASLELREVEASPVDGESIAEIESNMPRAQRDTMIALIKWRGVVDIERAIRERELVPAKERSDG